MESTKNVIPLAAVAITVWTPPPLAILPTVLVAIAVTIGFRTHSMTILNDGKKLVEVDIAQIPIEVCSIYIFIQV